MIQIPFNIHSNEKENKYKNIEYIKEILHNEKETIYDRYRALFTLREYNNERAVEILCECFDKKFAEKFSPLLKHEISFILE